MKKFENAEIKVLEFAVEDVITASNEAVETTTTMPDFGNMIGATCL